MTPTWPQHGPQVELENRLESDSKQISARQHRNTATPRHSDTTKARLGSDFERFLFAFVLDFGFPDRRHRPSGLRNKRLRKADQDLKMSLRSGPKGPLGPVGPLKVASLRDPCPESPKMVGYTFYFMPRTSQNGRRRLPFCNFPGMK